MAFIMKKLSKIRKTQNLDEVPDHVFEKVKEVQDSLADVVQAHTVLFPYLATMFPDQAAVAELVAAPQYRKHKKMRAVHPHTAEYLPFHLDDYQWLAKYAIRVLRRHKIHDKLDKDAVVDFFRVSPVFAKYRDDYAQNLTKAQVQYLLTQNAPNRFTTPHFSPARTRADYYYDQLFRFEVVDSMTRLGIDEHTVETALETDAAKWRKPVMARTFENRYQDNPFIDEVRNADPTQVITYTGHAVFPGSTQELRAAYPVLWNNLDLVKQDHRQTWLAYREYEYYQAHQTVIDELGTATANMDLTPTEAVALQHKVNQYHLLHQDIHRAISPKTIYGNNFLAVHNICQQSPLYHDVINQHTAVVSHDNLADKGRD